MKIGIVTFNSEFSYGAVLQAYALQTYLEKMGHTSFFLNCEYQLDSPASRSGMKWPLRLRIAVVEQLHKRLLRHVFSDFQRRTLNLDKVMYKDCQQLEDTPPEADAYIAGSDQIWNPNYCFSRGEGAVWLDFGNKQTRRISYAASFGDLELEHRVLDHWSQYAKRFDFLSVREEKGVDILKKLGRSDAVWVPDPTLLLDACEYDNISAKSKNSDIPSLFSYNLLTNWGLYIKGKEVIQDEAGVPSYDCRPMSFRHCLLKGGLVTPDNWIAKIREAKYVLTDSFHGLLFSLIFHRPFIVLRSRKSSRINSILKMVNLQHRLLLDFDNKRIKDLCHEEIDWSQVDRDIRQFREVGIRFLQEALS